MTVTTKYPVRQKQEPHIIATGCTVYEQFLQCGHCKFHVPARLFVFCEDCEIDCCIWCGGEIHLSKRPRHRLVWAFSPFPWTCQKTIEVAGIQELDKCMKPVCEHERFCHEDGTGMCHACLSADDGTKFMEEHMEHFFCLNFQPPDPNFRNRTDWRVFWDTVIQLHDTVYGKQSYITAEALFTRLDVRYDWDYHRKARNLKKALDGGKLEWGYKNEKYTGGKILKVQLQ